MPQADHYFSESPQGPVKRKQITMKLLDGERVKISTAAGVFSADDIDEGTAVLLRKAPSPPSGATVLDLGCGYGPIVCAYGTADPTLQFVAIDVNERALELTRENANSLNITGVVVCKPDEVDSTISFDVIYSNPPIRIGKKEMQAILRRWLMRLTPVGSAYLVVHKHLGSDSLHKWLCEQGWNCNRISSSHGYRVLEVTNATRDERP